MKTTSGRNYFHPKVLLAAVALAALVNLAHAQSADALIEKLLEKGILTANEAKDLREQSDNDFKTAFQTRMGMPDWVTGYKLSGDFRGRFEQFSSENLVGIDRVRLRYRVRLGLAVNMLDNLEAGLRLSSADAKGVGSQSAAGNPLSANSTMQDNATKKMIYIDTAYGKWTVLGTGDWQLAATIGKMDNPFSFTPMVFDPDLTLEGGALNGSYTINDKHAIVFAGGAFVLDEEPGTTHDPFMYGGQILWNAKWTPKLATSIGIGAFQIVSHEQLIPGGTVPNVNQGNYGIPYTNIYVFHDTNGIFTTNIFTGISDTHYTPLIADASVTYTLDSFPFYHGTFPIKFAGEFMANTARSRDNIGYWVGVTLGKSGTKKTWDITYRYEYLEANTWYDQLVDDDNAAFYATANYPMARFPSPGVSKGLVGGTNVKGHMVKFNYSFTDSFTFSASVFLNDLIILPQQPLPPANQVDINSGSIHFMADLMWKF